MTIKTSNSISAKIYNSYDLPSMSLTLFLFHDRAILSKTYFQLESIVAKIIYSLHN